MKVEIWSDFACPFCYLGKRRFEAGLERFEHKDRVEVTFRSFELDPDAPVSVPYDVHDMLASKYGMSRERAKAWNDDVVRQAAEVGLEYRMDTLKLTNTLDAHRLTHYAAQFGKRAEVSELLFKAHFTDSRHIGERETLIEIAAQAGLDREETARVLDGGQFADEVRREEQEGAALGIRGVPFYVIDRKYGVSGAQSPDVFLDVLRKAWEESKPLTMVNPGAGSADGGVCADGTCAPERNRGDGQ
ncbi:DsbA family oxidoreductase [Paenibacillus thermoaerophilus]|uniref:DsbA family oxidoreductase n=1 Tax=Paenibacillus thermoaerophilus TaxID=1215385 RepID=A0ABW2UYE0_9BACL|nr:DsbA family oxidoreductase [Paenibacillus thermoaerophilus]TMV17753.1 DsbA family oxidoreductase [Paenibacillus thermoaerophilus]